MKESGDISVIIGLISIGLSLYFIEELIISVGLIIFIFIVIILFYFRSNIEQINRNTQLISKFDKKLDLHNRLNKIENEIRILKGVKK